MDTKQQKEFITMLESIKVPCDYDMDCSEMKALFEIYIMNKKIKMVYLMGLYMLLT